MKNGTTDGLVTEVINITPAKAKKWLEHNDPNNRVIAWTRVETMANDMRADAWVLTHEAICFNAAGVLIDGQHRLHAIVQAGIAVKMLVAHNPNAAVHDPINRGRPRSIAQVLDIHPRIVSALNGLRMLESGAYSAVPMSSFEISVVYGHHQETIDALKRTGIMSGTGLLAGFRSAIIWTYPLEPVEVLEFAQRVKTGELLKKGDPAYAYRRWAERNPRMPTWPVVLATLNCLRHHLNHMKLSNVYIGEMGHRGITGRRRHLKIPFTPGTSLVPSGNWAPSRGEEFEAESKAQLSLLEETAPSKSKSNRNVIPAKSAAKKFTRKQS